jgi:RNA polymerase sigma-70 factor (ECF subfamily)
MHSDHEARFLRDINKNIGIVHRVCHTYFANNALERDDVFQEIMYQLWKSFTQFKGDSKFSTWMYRVALNTAIAHVRRSMRTPRSTELTEAADQAVDMSERINEQEDVERLYAAIRTLTEVDKAIIVLHLEDHSYDEIASITGLTKTNVSVRLVRIKRALKDQLQKTS